MLDIAIIGAGPAGLAAALRLHQKGFRPTIYESVSALQPLGVGLDVKVYAAREFDELGLLDELRAMSVEALESIFFTNNGQEIYAERCGKAMGYLYDQRFVHRGELQMMMYTAVIERLGQDAVVLGARCVRYRNENGGVTLDLEHRDGRTESVRADLAIAADGIRSAVRRQMHPESADPVYSGITMWRGVTLMEPFKSGGTILHIGDPRISTMIVYPIADNYQGSGKTLVNWVVEAERGETVEDWNQRGSVDEVMHLHADCHLDFIDLQQMMRDASEVYLFPLIRHEPLDSWIDGRVILIGDAAHAMYPRGGNGACQSIVDGGVLAEKLATIDDVDAALLAFQGERLTKVNHIVMAHRGEGYEVIRRLVAERTDGKPFDDIEQVLPLAEADEIFGKYHALVGEARPGHAAGDTTGFRTAAVPSPTH